MFELPDTFFSEYCDKDQLLINFLLNTFNILLKFGINREVWSSC